MSQVLEAVYDGTVLRPDTALALEPNTRVRLTIEPVSGLSFLQTAQSLNLSGPPDWAENLDQYLYGDDSSKR